MTPTPTYSTADVAERIMGCSDRWLIEQLRAGRFPGRKIGRHWRMTDQDIADALAVCSNNVRPVPKAAKSTASGLTPTSRKRVTGQ